MTQPIIVGELEIEVDEYTIKIPVREEFLLKHARGEIPDKELLELALEEAPRWLEVKNLPNTPFLI